MPNWCMTTIKFTGAFDDVTNLHDRIVKYTSEELLKSDFGPMWLGNVVLGFELCKPENLDAEDSPRCRGSITSITEVYHPTEDGESYFYIDTETAWRPMLKMWTSIIDKEYPSENPDIKRIQISYIATEPGNELYSTNDFDEWGDCLYDYGFEDEKNGICEFDNVGSEKALIDKMNELLKPRNIAVNSYDDIRDVIFNNDDINVYVLKLEYRDINVYE